MSIQKGTVIKLNPTETTNLLIYSIRLGNGNIIDAKSSKRKEIGEEVSVEKLFYIYWYYRVI